MRADAAMQSDLHHDACLPRCLHHGLAFADGVTGGLLDKHMRACLAGRDALQSVPVIRRGDDDDLRLLLGQQVAVILVGLRVVAVEAVHVVSGIRGDVLRHIAQSADLDAAGGDGLAQDVHAPPAGADQRRAILLRRIRTEDVKRRGSKCGGTGREEMAAGGHGRR